MGRRAGKDYLKDDEYDPLEDPNANWRNDPATERQILRLRFFGQTPPPRATKGQLADMLDRIEPTVEQLADYESWKTHGCPNINQWRGTSLGSRYKKPLLIAGGLSFLFLLSWFTSSSHREPVPTVPSAVTPPPRPIQTPIDPVTANVEPASISAAIPSATPEATPSATPLPTLAPTPKPTVKVTLKTVKTIYPDAGGTKKIDPGTELKVIAVAGGVMTVELNGQTFNVSKSEIIEHP